MKVYTLLTTTNKFALPAFVNLCKTLRATGVTVFAFPQSFSPEPNLASRIQVQIKDLGNKESDAAAKKDYVLASSIQSDVQRLQDDLKQLSSEASSYYVNAVSDIAPILSTVVLDKESWDSEAPVSEASFIDMIGKLSVTITTIGIRGKKQPTPLTQRVFVPLSALGQDLSQPVVQMASVPLTDDSVVGEISRASEPEPSGPLVEVEVKDLVNEHGFPDSLSPNQAAFAEALLIKKASNFVQAANMAGLSPSSAKKMATDITKKWPEFADLVKEVLDPGVAVAEAEAA